MSKCKTRREVLKGDLAAAASLPLLASAKPDQAIEVDIGAVENQLARPLGKKAKELLAQALKANREASAERLKTKCPENSEPCFVFSPRASEKRSW